MENNLALVEESELSLVDNNSMNAKQLKLMLSKTPQKYVRQRPAKGGGTWDYVSGGYIKKCLNLMFGWDWDFEVVSKEVQFGEAIVLGKLTCRTNGKTIVKMQFGNKDIIYKREPVDGVRVPLSIGNDFKSATTDALKKCASEIGIASDIFNKDDFREIEIVETTELDDLKELFDCKFDALTDQEKKDIERIISTKEKASYKKLFNLLKSK